MHTDLNLVDGGQRSLSLLDLAAELGDGTLVVRQVHAGFLLDTKEHRGGS